MPDPFVGALPERGPDLATSVGAVMVVLGFLIGARAIADNSFLTHLATGRIILDTAAVPTVDPYSFGAADSPWTVQSWLASTVYATLEAHPGPWAIRWLNGVLGSLLAGGLWALTAAVRALLLRTVFVGFVLLIGTFVWQPRPLLFGLVAMMAVLLVTQGRLAPAWLVPVFWLWVNTHGSFVLGGGLLVLIGVGAAIDGRRVPRAELVAVGWGGIGTLCGMIGPLGWRLVWFPFHLMGRNEALNHVAEWTSPSFRSVTEQLYLLTLLLLLAAASRRAGWRVLLPSVVFFAAGLIAVRNIGLAVLVIVALLAPSFAEVSGSLDGRERGLVARAITAMCVLGAIVAAATTVLEPTITLDAYPVAEVDWLEDRTLVANPDVRLGQRDFVGNYLHLRFGTEAGVFMDDRFDFHPLPIVRDHADLVTAGDFGTIVDRNDFDVLLWQSETPLHRWIIDQPDWTIALGDESWFVACRRGSAAYQRCVN